MLKRHLYEIADPKPGDLSLCGAMRAGWDNRDGRCGECAHVAQPQWKAVTSFRVRWIAPV